MNYTRVVHRVPTVNNMLFIPYKSGEVLTGADASPKLEEGRMCSVRNSTIQ
jgi:hypothetical protein